ncbi:MAG TPA: hypothetical protein VK280_13420 [Streptosporangiaceae bacterium]|nr:hypothetical protein [Streptosporangiaceae bacterium]
MLYGPVILGIVLVIPRLGLSALSGFTDACTAVAGVLRSRALDAFFAVLVIVTLVGSGSVWLGPAGSGAHRRPRDDAAFGAAPMISASAARASTRNATMPPSGAGRTATERGISPPASSQ